MSESSAEIKIFPRTKIESKEFALLLEKCMTAVSGVLYGVDVAAISNGEVSISEGWVLIRGRMVHITAGNISLLPPETSTEVDFPVNSSIPTQWYSASGTSQEITTITMEDYIGWGYLCVVVDLANEDSPSTIEFITEALPDDTENFNIVDGKAYLSIAQVAWIYAPGQSVDTLMGVVSATKIVPVYENTRTIYISTDAPTAADGNNGDIWFQYTE